MIHSRIKTRVACMPEITWVQSGNKNTHACMLQKCEHHHLQQIAQYTLQHTVDDGGETVCCKGPRNASFFLHHPFFFHIGEKARAKVRLRERDSSI